MVLRLQYNLKNSSCEHRFGEDVFVSMLGHRQNLCFKP